MRPVDYDDLRGFCRIDGWTCISQKPGRKTRKHEVWTKRLPDGTTLRAVISKGRGQYTPEIAAHILKHELRVTEREFRSVLRTGKAPSRPKDQPQRPDGEVLPLSLVQALLAAGYAEADLKGLSLAQAKELLKRPR